MSINVEDLDRGELKMALVTKKEQLENAKKQVESLVLQVDAVERELLEPAKRVIPFATILGSDKYVRMTMSILSSLVHLQFHQISSTLVLVVILNLRNLPSSP